MAELAARTASALLTGSAAADALPALVAREIQPRETVAIVGPNGVGWLTAYQALIDAGAVVLLFGADAPPAERRRWMDLAGGGRTLSVDEHGLAGAMSGEPVMCDHPAGTVLLPSSGTTGAPKLVPRSLESLRREGHRHRVWSHLTAADVVLLPLPMWHAYALGWVHAAIEAGCALTPVPPTALARCTRSINEGATVLAMVPATARLLAARACRTAPQHQLRLAMVGAGPVDTELEIRFRDGLGLGLARNYGCTETGALFSSAPGAPDGCVGHPLEGVEFRIVDPAGADQAPGVSGELLVRVDGGAWHPMGDLAVYTGDGLVPLGRSTRCLRRGDRWVAPEEIEAALRRHPDVVGARVYAIPIGDGKASTLHADVVHVRGVRADTDGLRAHLHAELAQHKVPDRLRLVGDLPRSPVGKPLPPRPVGLADAETLTGFAQAYKRSELLFTLLRMGILERLATAAATAGELATALGIDHEVCEQLVLVAEELGIVRAAPAQARVLRDTRTQATAQQAMPIVRLEELLSRSWVTRERLDDLGHTGVAARGFDRVGPTSRLRAAYQAVMHMPDAYRRCRAGLSLAHYHAPQRLLEITCGPGRYHATAGPAAGTLMTVGLLADSDVTCSDGRSAHPDDRFDLVVICNAIHLPGISSDLPRLAGLLAPGGRLLIDDVFLDAPGGLSSDVRLDWLTHGGLVWPTESATAMGLAVAGLTVDRTVHLGRPTCTLMLASAAQGRQGPS